MDNSDNSNREHSKSNNTRDKTEHAPYMPMNGSKKLNNGNLKSVGSNKSGGDSDRSKYRKHPQGNGKENARRTSQESSKPKSCHKSAMTRHVSSPATFPSAAKRTAQTCLSEMYENVYADVSDGDTTDGGHVATYERMEYSGSLSSIGDPEYQNPDALNQDHYARPGKLSRRNTSQLHYEQLATWVVQQRNRPKSCIFGAVVCAVTLCVLLLSTVILGVRYQRCLSRMERMSLTHMDRICRETENGTEVCYHFSKVGVALSEAPSWCDSVNGELLKVTSLAELRSIEQVLQTESERKKNVASVTNGATCTSSVTLTNHSCVNAINGGTDTKSNEWIIQNVIPGEWIYIKFKEYYLVDDFIIYNRCNFQNQISSFRISFSDGPEHKSQLNCRRRFVRHSRGIRRCPVDTSWRTTMSPRLTSSIRVLVTGFCSSNPKHPGLMQIETYGERAYWIDQTHLDSSLVTQLVHEDGDDMEKVDPEDFCYVMSHSSGVIRVRCGQDKNLPVICRDKEL